MKELRSSRILLVAFIVVLVGGVGLHLRWAVPLSYAAGPIVLMR